jgi:sigma-B regulation protein RsbU (phosphoserine phosphatase)
LGYHWIDENHLAIYVVDVCGHGVGPALHSVSVMNVLRFQSLSDTDFCSPREVMAGLNKRFPMENYNGTFFTAWYGVYDRSSCRLTYSSAGHPPAVLVLEKHGDGPRTELLQTANLFVGGLADTEYDEGFFLVNEFCRLYVFSDGVYEITRKDGSMWTFREFFLFLTQCSELGGSDLDHLFHHVLEITGRDVLDDDFTIVEVSLGCHEVQAG